MEGPEFSCFTLPKLDLYDVEKVVKEAYHKEGDPGRPPKKPTGIFKALIVKRLQQIPSERELCRRLWCKKHASIFEDFFNYLILLMGLTVRYGKRLRA